jgi:hypothetical protein
MGHVGSTPSSRHRHVTRSGPFGGQKRTFRTLQLALRLQLRSAGQGHLDRTPIRQTLVSTLRMETVSVAALRRAALRREASLSASAGQVW